MREDVIFVFGSNLAGRHGRGSAKFAMYEHGAEYGIGAGRTGYAYAIPTKGYMLEVLPLEEINCYIKQFILYARKHPGLKFEICNVGCGLAGYTPEQIAPMFKDAPSNCTFSKEFNGILGRKC